MAARDPNVTFYFNTLDTTKSGKVFANDAATFFRRSGIQDTQLAQIWELSDRLKSGYLTLQDFSIALKLISLAQNGHQPTLDNLKINVPAAVFKGFEEPRAVATPPARPVRPHTSPSIPAPVDKDGWVVNKAMKTKFDAVFQSLKPVNGKLSGSVVKPILLKSQLHVNVLGQIWELSDIDKDGALDHDEFSLAMYLLQKTREGEVPPPILPLTFIPPSHRVLYARVQKVNWLVPPATRGMCSDEFRAVDSNGQGVLSGGQLRPLLLRKGAPMNVLAHIWALCDINATGMLNEEQYALAVHLIQLHLGGKALPKTLPLELIPPSLRTSTARPAVPSPVLPPRGGPTASPQQHFSSKAGTLPVGMSGIGGLPMSAASQMNAFKSQTISPQKPVPPPPQPKAGIAEELASLNLGSGIDINADFSIIKELDTYTKETDTLTAEKAALQAEIKSTESNLSNAGVELADLKEQLSVLEKEVEEARAARDEIQSKADEADAERRKYEELITDMHSKAMTERQQISALQQQIASQEALRRAQEDELQKARDELSKLRQEESHYLHQVETGKRQLDTLMMNLRTVQGDTNQTQAKLVQIEAAKRSIDKTLAELAPLARRTGGGGPSILTNIHEVSQLSKGEQDVTQMSDITRATAGSSPVSSMSGFSADLYLENQQHDPFASTPSSANDSFNFGAAADPFQGDPFATDVYKGKGHNKARDIDNASTSSVDVIEENGVEEKTSACNTPQLVRKSEAKPEDPFSSDPFATDNGFETNPFGTPSSFGEDPFKSTDDPFNAKNDPFGSSSAPSEDPFKASSDPFHSSSSDMFQSGTSDPFSSKTSPEVDDFKSAEGDPFKPPLDDPFNSNKEDPFTAAKEDPFIFDPPKEDPFTKEDPFAGSDGFSADPFAQTSDPFASTDEPFKKNDLFRGSNNSIASSGPPLPAKGQLGSKNSLNFGSRSSLQNKNSLDNVSQVSEGSSTAAEAPDLFANRPPMPDPFVRAQPIPDDPFSNADPFASQPNADPFASQPNADPFAKPPSSDPFAKPPSSDPFASTGSPDPFGGQGVGSPDPFSSAVTEDDPFFSTSNKEDPFAPKSGKDDPFGGTSFDANFS